MKRLLVVVALAAAVAALKGPLYTVTVLAQNGLIVGSGNFFSPIVSDLDKAVAFYRDAVGLDAMGAPANAEQNAPLRNMFGLPDASLRWMVARPPQPNAGGGRGGVEIVEISKADGKRLERRPQDPGAFTLIVLVRDIDKAFAKAKAANAVVISAGGAPITVGRSKAFVLKDPDGHFVEVAQLNPTPESPAPADANILGVRVRLTVEDAAASMKLYQGLGLNGTMNMIAESNDGFMKMFGLPASAKYRLAMLDVPTTGLKLEFIDFSGVDRRTVRGSIQDPGSTRMQIQVRDVDAAIAALKSAGGVVQSTGGNTVELPGRGGAATKVAIVRDPNNLFLVLLQAAPPPQPAQGR